MINSLAPGRSECNSKNRIFNFDLLIGIFRSSRDNALRWMPQDLNDDKSTLVQVMAWCRQATSHYLSQYWLSLLLTYGIARPQWVKWCPDSFKSPPYKQLHGIDCAGKTGFIAPGRGFWSWFGGVCSLTYCNGNFRVTMVSEPFNVIL